MTSYIGRHADLYDIFYNDKPYELEAQFIHETISFFGKNVPGKLLELACGTGNHAFKLEKLGYEITAIDYSPDILACAQKKSAQTASSVKFQLADMRSLQFAPGTFDNVVCLFDSIGYVLTDESIARIFTSVHDLLKDDGLFVFEFWHAEAMLNHFDPVRLRRFRIPDGEILRISETSLNREENLAEVTYTIYELNDDGSYSSLKETQRNRFFTVDEMESKLKESNFTPLKWFAGFSNDQNISDLTWHIIAVARKSN